MRKLKIALLTEDDGADAFRDALRERIDASACAEVVVEKRAPTDAIGRPGAVSRVLERLVSGLERRDIGRTQGADPERKAANAARACHDAPADVVLDVTARGRASADDAGAAFGVWRLLDAWDVPIASPFAGLREAITRRPTIEARLEIAAPRRRARHAPMVAHFSAHDRWIRNRETMRAQSIALILKHLEDVRRDVAEALEPIEAESGRAARQPSARHIAWYLGQRVARAPRRIVYLLNRLAGRRPNSWRLFFGRGDILTARLANLREFAPPRNEFWADPFHARADERSYVFFENFDRKRKRGRICVSELRDGALTPPVDALGGDRHLSYPQVFEWRGERFLMPETQGARRLELWRAVEFPHRWELAQTAFEGQAVADATIWFEDGAGEIWLFLNKSAGDMEEFNAELHLYRLGDALLGDPVPHRRNPVLIDSRSARGAGALFRDRQGRLIRPSQHNVGGVYGAALNLNEVVRLTLDEYEERLVRRIRPDFGTGLIGAHHLARTEDGFILDGCRRYG